MKVKLLAVSLAVLLTTSCGPSAEDKARIRQVETAYSIASMGNADNSDALMNDLQRAVDLVPDGKAREEILSCQSLLKMYVITKQRRRLFLEGNLLAIGHGRQSTKKEFDIANANAEKEVPLPDYDPIAKCEVITLPSLTKYCGQPCGFAR